jgi:CheY-like chemotaxis protein
MTDGDGLTYEARPVVLVIADQPGRARMAEESVIAAGGRVQASVSLAEAMQRIETVSVPDTILLEVDDDGGAALDRLLGRINQLAAQNKTVAIASVSISMIDPVAARFDARNASILCKPDAAERVSALTLAWKTRDVFAHDRAADVDTMRLQRLSDEVARIAKTLTALSSGGEGGSPQTGFSDAMIGYRAEALFEVEAQISASDVRNAIRLRRMREQYFPPDMFADPAWDILLDLAAARLERAQVAVSSLCIAAAVPATTALRWIRTMTDHALLVRTADPADGRRVFIELSDPTASGMMKYMIAAKKASGLVI